MSITLKIKDKEIKLDEAQLRAFNLLDELKNNYSTKSSKSPFFNKIFSKKSVKLNNFQGLYLYGKVGRGKSMLMRNFFEELPISNKIYLHFNSFMQQIHRELYLVRQDLSINQDQLIEIVTKNIIGKNKLLCLDEFQVDDVTDALILRRIFSYIFNQNILVIFTSNSEPQDLYQNGLQRELFLKFVNETLKKHCQIFNLDSENDYREKFLHKIKKHYFYPINSENNEKILNIFSHLIHKKEPYLEKIILFGRELIVKKAFENIAVFDFKELCEDNLGVADYQAICRKYHIIFLLNVPKLNKEDRNVAKRLILFIDEVYENKVTLLILAAVKIEEILETGKDAKVFKRTISRLKEVMSDSYGKMLYFE